MRSSLLFSLHTLQVIEADRRAWRKSTFNKSYWTFEQIARRFSSQLMYINILWRFKLYQSHDIVVVKTSHYKTQNVQCKFVLCIVRSGLEFTGSRFWIIRLRWVLNHNKQSLQLKIRSLLIDNKLTKENHFLLILSSKDHIAVKVCSHLSKFSQSSTLRLLLFYMRA